MYQKIIKEDKHILIVNVIAILVALVLHLTFKEHITRVCVYVVLTVLNIVSALRLLHNHVKLLDTFCPR